MSNHALIPIISGWISYKNVLKRLQIEHPGATMDIMSFSKYYEEISTYLPLPKPSGENLRDRDRAGINNILSSRMKLLMQTLIRS